MFPGSRIPLRNPCAALPKRDRFSGHIQNVLGKACKYSFLIPPLLDGLVQVWPELRRMMGSSLCSGCWCRIARMWEIVAYEQCWMEYPLFKNCALVAATQ